MKVFQVPMLRSFQINPAFLEKPQTLPFDMPTDKKEKILSLLLWGLNAHQPDFLALDHEAIGSVSGKRHVDRIKGIKVDKRTLLSVSVRSEKELREVLESERQIPSLMMVIDILDPGVPASRRWLFQLKNVVADAIRKTIYEDKRIDEKLLDGPTFDFCLKNFEDPIDVIEFLNLAISIRSENKETGEAIDEAFIAMVSDRISPLKPNWVKVLFSLIITDSIPDIQKLTNLSEEEIGEAIDELQIQGLVHNRGETPALPLYLKNLKKPGLLIGVIDRMKGEMDGEGFGEIEEFYFRIAKEINPKDGVVEQPLTRAETVRAISYPALETDDIDKLILSLEAPFMEEVSKEIENPDRMIAIVNEVLVETLNERIRGIALAVRALAHIKKGYLEKSRRDLEDGSKISPDVLKISVPFYRSYGDLYRERANYNEAIECYNYALKSAEESLDEMWISQASVGIAEVHLKQANYEGAEKLVREGLKVAEELGENGKGVAAQALDLMGNIQYDLGNARSAIEYYEQALSIVKDVYGERHPDVATILNNVGSAWYALGEPEKAIEYYEQALSIGREMYGERHPAVATRLNNIGMAWHALGEHKKAIEYLERALSIGREVYGERHPDVATTLNNIGMAWHALGEPEKAIEYYEQALSIDRDVYGERHPAVATFLNNIGMAWHALGEHKKAIEYYEQALSIDRDVYGERHPDVATRLNNIGMAWYALGDLQRAETFFQQSYSILREFYGDDHPRTRTVKGSLEFLKG